MLCFSVTTKTYTIPQAKQLGVWDPWWNVIWLVDLLSTHYKTVYPPMSACVITSPTPTEWLVITWRSWYTERPAICCERCWPHSQRDTLSWFTDCDYYNSCKQTNKHILFGAVHKLRGQLGAEGGGQGFCKISTPCPGGRGAVQQFVQQINGCGENSNTPLSSTNLSSWAGFQIGWLL